jgi:DNA phosphorothioation-associated putative methyltransferase
MSENSNIDSVGKKVGGSLYIHRSAIDHLSEKNSGLLKEAIEISGNDGDWNVARFERSNVALLVYEDFKKKTFPALLESCRIDLFEKKATTRSYRSHANPPILHRKELLLAPDDPLIDYFGKVTKQLEEKGLFQQSYKIGFRRQWSDRLKSNGVTIKGHQVEFEQEEEIKIIDRHKTAMARYQLSQPMQLLIRNGLIEEETTIFDYGCGQGDDINALQQGGYDVQGWDPHYQPDAKKRKSNVVNIGFVLNVIEDQDERKEALIGAWKLTKQVLSVGFISGSSGDFSSHKRYGDGYVTSRGTFQKYYSQMEAKEYISEALGEIPIAAAPGIFFVFKDKLLEQTHLLNRRTRQNMLAVTLKSTRERKPGSISRTDRLETLQPHLELLWQAMLDRGRILTAQEVPAEVKVALKEARISIKNAIYYCHDQLFEAKDLETSAQKRREDFLVYFALTMFTGGKGYSELPPSQKADVKTFFGTHADALIEARTLLFSIGDREEIHSSCEEASDEDLGYLIDNEYLQFHPSILENLNPILRCYVGSAEVYNGDLSGADLIKIHISSGKLTAQYYDDFSKPLPELKQRIKIDMRNQQIDTFDYASNNRQYLFLKSLYLPEEHEQYDAQASFDNQLLKLDLFDLSNYGPEGNLFDEVLQNKKLKINGFEIRPV